MEARRRLLMQKSRVIDTSPKIKLYGYRYIANGTATPSPEYCITEIYEFSPVTEERLIAFYGIGNTNRVCLTYIDGTFIAYLLSNDTRSPSAINKDINGMSFTLLQTMIDDSYAYLVDTGEILFAGKNSIYYGHKNISELN